MICVFKEEATFKHKSSKLIIIVIIIIIEKEREREGMFPGSQSRQSLTLHLLYPLSDFINA